MRHIVLGLAVACFCVPAQAALVTTTVFTGTVDFNPNSDPVGLSASDVVTAVAAYDTNAGDADFEFRISDHVGASLTITPGNFTYVATDDSFLRSGDEEGVWLAMGLGPPGGLPPGPPGEVPPGGLTPAPGALVLAFIGLGMCHRMFRRSTRA